MKLRVKKKLNDSFSLENYVIISGWKYLIVSYIWSKQKMHDIFITGSGGEIAMKTQSLNHFQRYNSAASSTLCMYRGKICYCALFHTLLLTLNILCTEIYDVSMCELNPKRKRVRYADLECMQCWRHFAWFKIVKVWCVFFSSSKFLNNFPICCNPFLFLVWISEASSQSIWSEFFGLNTRMLRFDMNLWECGKKTSLLCA